MAKPRGKTVPNTGATVDGNELSLAKISQIFQLLRIIAYGFFGCLAILCAGYALRPFAGQTTVLSIFFSFLADIKFVAAITLAGTACGWAVGERLLRRKTTKQLQGRIVEMEKRLDPNRTSSELTTRGTTNPKDK